MLNRLDGVVYVLGTAEQVAAASDALMASFLLAGDAEEVGVLPSPDDTLFRARFTNVQLDLAERLAALSIRFPGVEAGAAYEARTEVPSFGACAYDSTGEVLLESNDGSAGMSEAFMHRFRHFSG